MTNREVEAFLSANIDEKYRVFNARIVVPGRPMLGVRIPVMRELAQKIARDGDFEKFRLTYPLDTFEGVMLRGMAIGYLRGVDLPRVVGYVREIVPLFDSWAHVDCVCVGLKVAGKHRAEFFPLIEEYLASTREFEIRFAVVMLMTYYLTDDYIDYVLLRYSSIRSPFYYVQMGVAWGVSVCFVKFRDRTLQLLKSGELEVVIHNMAIRKIIESLRVSADDKTLVRSLKR